MAPRLPMSASACALYAIVARDARVAVVFRRGPTRHIRMLRWDLARDVVEPGQWLYGAVETTASALSPDGELLAYCARKRGETFTAVSRPPYFTALAFFGLGANAHGGFFPSARELVVGRTFGRQRDEVDTEGVLRLTDMFAYFFGDERRFESWEATLYGVADAHHGFWAEAPGGVQRKCCPARRRLLLVREPVRYAAFAPTFAYRLVDGEDGGGELSLGPRDWVDWDHEGSLLYAEHGRLYRQRVPASLSVPRQPPRLVADLREQTFERLEAPAWATRWPKGRPTRKGVARSRR
jgi:hypothetical protein